MASPTSALTVHRPDLATVEEISIESQRRGFIAYQVLPIVTVGKKVGIYGRIPLDQLLQNADTSRAPGANYARGNFTFDRATYACAEHGYEEPIDDQERDMYSSFYHAELVAAARAFGFVLRNAEKRVSAAVFNASTWSVTAVTNEWDDAANATPRANVKAAMIAVWEASGLWPNALIINHIIFEHLKDVAEIIDRLKYAGFTDPRPSNITQIALAQALGIERVIVAGSPKNTANEGQAVAIAPIWSSEYAMVAKIAREGEDFKEPALGRTFHWPDGGSQPGGTIEMYREEKIRSDIVRVRHDVGEVIDFVAAGELLSNIIT